MILIKICMGKQILISMLIPSRSLAQSIKSFFRKWRDLLTKIHAEQQFFLPQRRLILSHFEQWRFWQVYILQYVQCICEPINLSIIICFGLGNWEMIISKCFCQVLEVKCGMCAPVYSIIAANLKQLEDFLSSHIDYRLVDFIFSLPRAKYAIKQIILNVQPLPCPFQSVRW